MLKHNRLIVIFILSLSVLLAGCSSESKQATQTKDTIPKNDQSESVDIKAPSNLSPNLIRPENLVYKGAFRLPEGSNGSSWEYSGYAMTYYPDGDPAGSDDGYPGSIFAIGHDQQQYVSEISIPRPIISSKKNSDGLNVASTLQEFQDITNGSFGELEIPRAGLEYLPPQGTQKSGKLHFAFGEHFQFEQKPSHGWSELNLFSPQTAGPWYLGNYTNYITNDYLFEIPQEWAEANTPSKRLATGRFRDGTWGGLGPALLAYQPWNKENPPTPKEKIKNVTPLLLYGSPQRGSPEIRVSPKRKMKTFKEADEWSGGAWLTAGKKSAVIFVGTKATGKTWYGFANGVVYPTDPESGEKIPEVPPWPYDDRGWWSQGIKAQIIFYNPSHLAAVAKGKMETWEPQPYASLDIDKYLFDPGFDHKRKKRYSVGAASFDRVRGTLYIFERRADEEKSIIHVFKIASQDDS